MKKSKIVSLALAGTLTVAAMLAGTYAWTSISQKATNEVTGEVNPGGRLHDDFNGTNKDIYVENFTSNEDGSEGAIIYARIKLDEYLSIGTGAGTEAGDKNQIGGDENTTITNPDTWTTFKLEDEDNSIFRNYFEWTWGGSTEYMPTFNKNKDSLEAEINGTLAGPDGDKTKSDDAYGDYVVYKENPTEPDKEVKEEYGLEIYDYDEDERNEDEGLNAAIIEVLHDGKGGIVRTFNGTSTAVDENSTVELTGTDENGDEIKITATVIAVEKTTDDENNEIITAVTLDLGGTDSGDDANEPDVRVAASAVHTTKTTLETLGVINMTEWIAKGCQPGPYWVYDNTDGWAYWAQGIEPGTATGCLLTGIERKGSIVDKYHYAINVTAEFATAGDWGAKAEDTEDNKATGFHINGISEDGLYLLNTIAGGEKDLIINLPENYASVKPGETLTLNASVMLGAQVLSDDVTWSVSDATDTEGTKIESTETAEGTLTVGSKETAEYVTVTAALANTPEVTASKQIKIGDVYTVTVNETDAYVVPENVYSTTLTATVKDQRGKVNYDGVKWKLAEAYTGASIDETSGELTITDETPVGTIQVEAISKADETAVGKGTVAVKSQIDYVALLEVTETKKPTVKIDGVEWYVLRKQDVNAEANDGDEALLWSVYTVKGWGGEGQTSGWKYYNITGFPFVSEDAKDHKVTRAEYNWWQYSNLRAWLNSTESKSVETTDEGTSTTTTTIYEGFLADKEILSANAVTTEIHTRKECNLTGADTDFITTEDKVFVFTQADLYGHVPGNNAEGTYAANGTAVAKDYTVDGEMVISADLAAEMRKMKEGTGWCWLRSPRYNDLSVSVSCADGNVIDAGYGDIRIHVRPALWINLSSSGN